MQTQVVLDSNIWISERMLRHGNGSAFRLFLARQNARLVLPEIVQLEVRRKMEESISGLIRDMENSYQQLLAYTGSLKEMLLPSTGQVMKSIEDAFKDVGGECVFVPFSLESAKSSLEKCLRHEPPSGSNNEQFRDGVIWADCLNLAEHAPVIFVTQDLNFFKDRKAANGLAPNLLYEATNTKHGVTVHNNFQAVLDLVREEVPLDPEILDESFRPLVVESCTRMIVREGYDLGSRVSESYTLFATENPLRVYTRFELSYKCFGADHRIAKLHVSGDGDYFHISGELSNLRLLGANLEYYDLDGERHVAVNHFAFASAILGHRTVQYEVKQQL
jgi:hypothetical protein